jgi:flagellar protein FlgJ
VAISPPSDIVLDVMRAADPERVEAARAHLQRASRSAAGADASFPTIPAAAPKPAPNSAGEAYRQFEAMVLGTFVQSMLPDEASSVYGEGLAGDMWKSILGQHLGDAISQRGGIGIANRLLNDRYREGDRVVPLAGAAGEAHAELDTQTSLSQALLQQMQRATAQTIGADTEPRE